ncbi:MAG TPA: PRC-barrel domain-containing protein [Gemmataceae bacterium]|nr:PRC-barrel domain-containing protein [Gemmataceae bacterium]
MRTLVPFALALAGTVAFTTDASAFGRRRAAAAANAGDGGCYGGGYATSAHGGCYGGAYSSSGYGGCSGSGYASSASGGCAGSGYATSAYGGCYGSGQSAHSRGGCYGSGYSTSSHGGGYTHSGYGHGSVAYGTPMGYPVAYSGGTYGASHWPPVTMTGGRAAVIQATDGTYYTLGADGTYYAAGSSGVAIHGGVITQSHSGVTTVSGSSTASPAAPAGANLGSGVIPAGGTAPLSTSGTTTTSTFRAKQVLGTRILIQNDTQVGTVEDLVSDQAGNLDYLIVSTSDNKLVTVPWDAAKFDAERKTAMVNVTQEVWRTVPTYTAATYPQFYTPAYRTDIYKAYGLRPRDLRRIP